MFWLVSGEWCLVLDLVARGWGGFAFTQTPKLAALGTGPDPRPDGIASFAHRGKPQFTVTDGACREGAGWAGRGKPDFKANSIFQRSTRFLSGSS